MTDNEIFLASNSGLKKISKQVLSKKPFFENISNINQKVEIGNTTQTNMVQNNLMNPVALSPVSGDYVLSAGDQLIIRVWGSLEVNYRAVIDRNGLISIPKIGTVQLQGTKLSLAENVIKQSIDKYYKNY